MPVRKIVQIDEEKCDGCGQCVPSCAEGAIRIIDGKARLVSDVYCDGLGACLGRCPQDAITIVEREAGEFDEVAVATHLATKNASPPGRCPGTAVQNFGLKVLPTSAPRTSPQASAPGADGSPRASQLSHWPVQLSLIPPGAAFLQNADLLLAAQCVAFAMADFHERLLRQNPVAIACPKLDDGQTHLAKLTSLLQMSDVKSLSVIHMEVPCCTGLVRMARAAIEASGKDLPLHDVVISTRGELVDSFCPPA